jgi:hypothetical protein
MKRMLFIITVLGLQSFYIHSYLDGSIGYSACVAWNPWRENAQEHTSVEIHNSKSEQLRIKYCKKNAGFAAILWRARILQPGKKTKVILLKDKCLTYQQQFACPEGCEQTGTHCHWGKKIKISFKPSEVIRIGYSRKVTFQE